MSYDVFWQHPIGKLPEDWTERNAFLGNWFVKVGGHKDDCFIAVMVNITTSERVELNIAKTTDLDLACTLAGSAAQIMIKELEASKTTKARISRPSILFCD